MNFIGFSFHLENLPEVALPNRFLSLEIVSEVELTNMLLQAGCPSANHLHTLVIETPLM